MSNDRKVHTQFRFNKCSYIVPARRPNLWSPDSYGVGNFNLRPVTNDNVHELIEYLWFIEEYRYGKLGGILSSYTQEFEDSVHHVIYATRMGKKIQLGSRYYDGIELRKFRHTVDKQSGEIMQTSELLKSVPGRVRPWF